MKIQVPPDTSNVKTLDDVIRFSAICIGKIVSAINGNIDLIDNGTNVILAFNFPQINTDVGVAHSLGTVPRGYIKIGGNGASGIIQLQDGKSANTNKTLYLQSGSGIGTASILVF